MAGAAGTPSIQGQKPTGYYSGAGAPAGYTFDPVQNQYVPTTGSPTDALAQRTRMEGMQDTAANNANTDERLKQTFADQALAGLSNNTSGSTYGAGAVPAFTGSYPIPATVSATSGTAAGQLQASDDAAFAKAKDEAANTANAALQGLQGTLQSRGMGGAGYEAGQIGNTVVNAADQIGEASRQNAQTKYQQNLDRANVETQAEVAQRGQDLGAEQGMLGSQLTARGQDISAAEADANRRAAAVNGLVGSLRY